MLEPAVTSVVGVWDIGFGAAEEVQEQGRSGFLSRVFHGFQEFEMASVHAKDPVEPFEIGPRNARGLVASQVVAASAGVFGRSLVGPFAHMVGLRAGGTDFEPSGEAFFINKGSKHSFGGGRTADVACANEKDVNFLFHSVVRKG